jgi:hypothetical protein
MIITSLAAFQRLGRGFAFRFVELVPSITAPEVAARAGNSHIIE